ncbi:seipin isoform X2 [Lingula anatina]|uniref:Seipin n=1 Tax=Lingula anatina TaxID=7574 RepID=A0A1S3KAH7_LINAN|nr:seipin isoform X2 [Lingula anatina]|eukprot:XP_013419266.1 seipin isoform X2 [Lingula anatina]
MLRRPVDALKKQLQKRTKRAYDATKDIFSRLLGAGIVLIFVLWTAVFLYGSFYYAYMPQVSHSRSVHFQINTSCEANQKTCSYPFANISLVKDGRDQLLLKGQPYKVLLELEMPETPVNEKLGMFMVEIQFYSKGGVITKTSSRAVSSMLRYKSPLLQTITTWFFSPWLLFGFLEQKQTVLVELFSQYYEDAYLPSLGALISLKLPGVDNAINVYSAELIMQAHFTGLRYILFYWPITSSMLGIGTIFFFLALVALFSWHRFLWTPSSDKNDGLQPVRFERKLEAETASEGRQRNVVDQPETVGGRSRLEDLEDMNDSDPELLDVQDAEFTRDDNEVEQDIPGASASVSTVRKRTV